MSCKNQIFSFETKRHICLRRKTIFLGVCVLKRSLGGAKRTNLPNALPKFISNALQRAPIHLNPAQKKDNKISEIISVLSNKTLVNTLREIDNFILNEAD